MFGKHQIVLHPFLFTLFPILSLYATNIRQEPFGAVVRSIAIGLAVVGMLLGLMRLAMKDWHRAGLVVTLAMLLFFGFGSISRVFAPADGVRPIWLLWVWLVIFLAGEIWIGYRLRGTPRGATRVLNITGLVALSTCLYGVVAYGLHAYHLDGTQLAQAAPAQTATAQAPIFQTPVVTQTPVSGEQPPDIYYIILDGHARSDVLNEMFAVDNRPFISFLKSRGFIVASTSESNYPQTALSLASSLNFSYIDQKMPLDPESNDRGPLTELIKNNDVQRFLQARGYHTVAFANGFADTEMSTADEFLQDPAALNNFEVSLLSQSPAGPELSPQMAENYRQHILWQKNELEKQAQQPGPKFVFAHSILPHPPFVFSFDNSQPVTLNSADGSQFQGTRAEYYEGYRQQVMFTDALAADMIAYLLDHSARKPVIIVQGDHGSGLDLDWNSQANTCLRERFSIMNAYYLPKQYNLPGQNASRMIYASITPVNSFRVVFDAYFDAGLPILPDRSFFALWDRPYDLKEVTGKFEKSCNQ